MLHIACKQDPAVYERNISLEPLRMITAQYLNAIGLVLNMAGVVLLFFFGLPQPSHAQGVGLGLEDGTMLPNGMTVAEQNELIRRRERTYKVCAYAALGLLFSGFACQLIATIFF